MLCFLLGLGSRALGSDEDARLWLTAQILSLGNQRPINLVDSVEARVGQAAAGRARHLFAGACTFWRPIESMLTELPNCHT